MFVLGKYLGMMMTLVAQVAIMVLVYTIFADLLSRVFHQQLLYVSALLLVVELMLLTSWATLFFDVFSADHSRGIHLGGFPDRTFGGRYLAVRFGIRQPAAQPIAEGVVLGSTNFELFNIRSHAVHELPIPWEQLPAQWPGGTCYTAAVLGLAMIVFERRDLKWYPCPLGRLGHQIRACKSP